MWVSPHHPDRDRLLARQRGVAEQAPPEPSGETLASFPRRGRSGEEQELRVVLDEFQGHAYLSIRLWTRDGATGAWWPTRKGCSVRMAEARGVAEAMLEALSRTQRAQHPRQQQLPVVGAGVRR